MPATVVERLVLQDRPVLLSQRVPTGPRALLALAPTKATRRRQAPATMTFILAILLVALFGLWDAWTEE
jgi:hypothetical protein